MFAEYVLEFSSAEYENRILLIDDADLDDAVHFSDKFAEHGFDVVRFKDDLSFRTAYEDRLKNTDGTVPEGYKILVLADSHSYIPYDLLKRMRTCQLSLDRLFPKLNAEGLRRYPNLDLDLLATAYQNNYDDWQSSSQTQDFLRSRVYSGQNVARCLQSLLAELMRHVSEAQGYRDWLGIAEDKARIDVLAAKYEIHMDTTEANRRFRDYVLSDFGKLSSEISKETPVLVSRAMEYMHDESDKFVVIVMDGMSEFDWKILSESFLDIRYQQTGILAMIPSTTSVSRQCLLAGKYPLELMEPWKQSREKQEFIACAERLGYTDKQTAYARGYDADFGSFVRCGAVIINDVDNMVHAQHQGKTGMLQDMELLAKQKKLASMTRRFLREGFDVYITADHGNTLCSGMGKLMGTGLETETKSHRMLVLQNFADKEGLKTKYGLIEYPKYYLMKEFDYLICDVGDSFDAKGETVMTHGGISLDEVVVPFIKIKTGENNG